MRVEGTLHLVEVPSATSASELRSNLVRHGDDLRVLNHDAHLPAAPRAWKQDLVAVFRDAVLNARHALNGIRIETSSIRAEDAIAFDRVGIVLVVHWVPSWM